ncbi:hypothetical protein ACWD1Y_07980 [Streptomyces sp. NPDC002814]
MLDDDVLGDVLGDADSEPPEQPAVARAIRQMSPAAGLKKLRIAYAPALVISQ